VTHDAATPLGPAHEAGTHVDASTSDARRPDGGHGSVAPADGGGKDGDGASDASISPPVNCVGATPASAYVSDARMCVYVFAAELGMARQMAFAPNGDLFLNNGNVTVMWDANGDGSIASAERAVYASAGGLNHGLAFPPKSDFVYASSPTTVFRWPYTRGAHGRSAAAEIVVQGIPTGGHITRTLAFDSKGNLLVSVGSATNVDTATAALSTRGQIRRFAIPATIPAGGIAYSTGTVVAQGMRNEVGLFVDTDDAIWSVENGRDNLTDTDFGGDIHNDNPAEELNRVDQVGSTFFGYPYCYSVYKVAGAAPGSQWADESIPAAQAKTDAWCQSAANVHPPAAVMPAHWAPLGIVRYAGNSLPFGGDLIVTAHGSWNRSPAVGRLLARAKLVDGKVASITPIVGQKGTAGALVEGTWDARPVDVRQGPDEALYFSDDLGGRIFKVGYANQ
jgi:glucose/arabinose dehydrogenase